jgi:hypothetical protein
MHGLSSREGWKRAGAALHRGSQARPPPPRPPAPPPTQRDAGVERVSAADVGGALHLLRAGPRLQDQRRHHLAGGAAPPLLLRGGEVAPAVGGGTRDVGARALVCRGGGPAGQARRGEQGVRGDRRRGSARRGAAQGQEKGQCQVRRPLSA